MSLPDSVRHDARAVAFESYDLLGYNYRMTDIQAAVGREQLKRLSELVSRRRALADRYREALAAIRGVALPEEPAWARSNWQSFCVGLPPGRDQRLVMQAMASRGRTWSSLLANLALGGARWRRHCWSWKAQRGWSGIGAPLAFDSLARLGLWEPLGGELPHQQLHVYKRKRQPAIEEAWELTEAILGRLRDEARGRGAELAVVYVPSRMEVSDRDWDLTRLRYGFDDKWDRRLVVQRLEAVGSAVGFPVLDLTRTFREADQGLWGEPYLRLDSHWTRLGHRAAAQAVAEFLRSLGWLPPVSCVPH